MLSFSKDRVFKENLFLEGEEESKIDYKREILREKRVLEKIDQVPLTQEERPISLFKVLARDFQDVKWIGRSISIESRQICIKPPYRVEDCKGRESADLAFVKKIVENLS